MSPVNLRKCCMSILCLILATAAHGEETLSPTEVWFGYEVVPNTTYLTADGVELELDVYARRGRGDTAVPTVVFFHGGGWVGGSKEGSALSVLPYLERGWAAVNVQYRLGGTALAPAAVEDTRCALHWVVRNADRYGFDPNRIVLTGVSAGGHLSLITGMLTGDAGFDRRCPVRKGGDGPDRALASSPDIKVAAIVNWAGITDVVGTQNQRIQVQLGVRLQVGEVLEGRVVDQVGLHD